MRIKRKQFKQYEALTKEVVQKTAPALGDWSMTLNRRAYLDYSLPENARELPVVKQYQPVRIHKDEWIRS
jgi:hypothetical protein